jgi:hypothetical protein
VREGAGWTMPTIDLTDEELAALTAAIRRLIAEDRFPAPRTSTPSARRSRSSPRRASGGRQRPKALRPRPMQPKPPKGRTRAP